VYVSGSWAAMMGETRSVEKRPSEGVVVFGWEVMLEVPLVMGSVVDIFAVRGATSELFGGAIDAV